MIGDVFVNRVGQAIHNDQLEVFLFKNLFKTDSSLFRVYSGSGRERRGDSVVGG